VAALAETFSGKPDKMRKYALLFLSSARDGLAEMDEALAMEDLAHLSELGHRTKSAARAVGAMQFGNLCYALEQVRKDADAANAAGWCRRCTPCWPCWTSTSSRNCWHTIRARAIIRLRSYKSPMHPGITPGLLILHGNQMEQLRAAVFQWLRNHPLGALEPEIFLVQSNGVAEWLKIALAEENGICAAARVALPARFLWDAYRGMLGRERVPPISAFDKGPLTWRLMRLLPTLLADPVFAPLRHFLADGEAERRLQLAERLADLFDQYQVYRADWLDDWAAGRDQLRNARGDVAAAGRPALAGQLWRAVIADVEPHERGLGRATVHTEFVRASAAGEEPLGRLPRRVVIFGVSALPFQTLQALASLARHTQVLLAVPNPCQYYWGDIIEGRDLLRSAHRRQQLRNGQDLGQIPLEELHAHSHPLLASWGQGRDFVRMLDEFDEAAQAAAAKTTRWRRCAWTCSAKARATRC
jgi:HPt (histidine-containing phosphotransfer) domain-containing protein